MTTKPSSSTKHQSNGKSSSKSKSKSKSSSSRSNPVSPTGQPRSPGRDQPSGNTGLLQARLLVQEILDQVTYNDSPPMNNNDIGGVLNLGMNMGMGMNMTENDRSASPIRRRNDGSVSGSGSNSGSRCNSPKSPRLLRQRRKQQEQGHIHNLESASSNSVANTTITTVSNSQNSISINPYAPMSVGVGVHVPVGGLGVHVPVGNLGPPRNYSRQHHILPTIYSPANRNGSRSSTSTATSRSTPAAPPSVTSSGNSIGIPTPLRNRAIVEPSPTHAEIGDNTPFLPSPSFANSHLDLSYSDSTLDNSTPQSRRQLHQYHQPQQQVFNFTQRTALSGKSSSSASTSASSTPAAQARQHPPTSVSIRTPRTGNGTDSQHHYPMPSPPPVPSPARERARNIRPGHGAEVAMGNLSLAALCVRTIDCVSDEIFKQIPDQYQVHDAKHANGKGRGRGRGRDNGQSKNGDGSKQMMMMMNGEGEENAARKLISEDEEDDMLQDDSKEEHEHLSSWEKEVERAPTFTSEDSRKALSVSTNGSGSAHGNVNAKDAKDVTGGGSSRSGSGEEEESGYGSLQRTEFLKSLEDDRVGAEGGTNTNLNDVGGMHKASRRESSSSHSHNEMDDGDDDLLFPEAKNSTDLDQDLGVDDIMNPILEEDEEEDDDDMLTIMQTASKEDGVILSAVAEGDEYEEGVVTPTFYRTNSAPSPRYEDIGEIPMNTTIDPSKSFPPTSTATLSPDSAAHTKLTLSPDQPVARPRMQMFGSEYARHLQSESPFSPAVTKAKTRSFSKKALTSMSKKSKRTSSSAAATSAVSSPSSPTGFSVGSATTASQFATMTQHDSSTHRATMSVSSISQVSSMKTSGARAINLEDASSDVLTSAITDIVVTHGTELPPKGYYRISQTGNGTELDTLKNMTGGGIGKKKMSSVFLNVKKEPKWDRAVQRPCVTALTVIFPDRNEFVPPGFCVVRRYNSNSSSSKKGGKDNEPNEDASKAPPKDDSGSSSSAFPANLNYGTSGERVYLCYRRSREGNPVTGLIPLQPSNREAVPEGYTVLERSPRNFVADINSKAGPPVFLAFRQRLANLETLRPLPLVMSVHYSNNYHKNDKKKGKHLQAYYCTGGTVVPSEIGKYHVMDRSTHPLISPSSVTNRLSLIQAARNKNTTGIVDGNNNTRGSSPSELAPGLVADGLPGLGTSPTSGSSLQYSHSYRSDTEENTAAQSEVDSVASESQPKESFVDGILHLVGVKAPSNPERRSLLVGVMDYMTPSSKREASLLEDALSTTDSVGAHSENGFSISSTAKSSIFLTREDTNLQDCFDAMKFIPLVECPAYTLDKGNVGAGASEILLEARIAVITPILTACYTHHGGSALLAVEGLVKLLNDTDFFLPDVAHYEDPNVHERLTLLDLAIQVVCDVANSTARETNFLPCIEFVAEATYYSKGILNARTIGYIMRFYLFIFYFGASVPTSSSWPRNKTSGYSRKEILDEANDTLLLSEDELDKKNSKRRRGYVPGGAPQAAALALKEFVSIFVGRLRKMTALGRVRHGTSIVTASNVNDFMNDYVGHLIDGAIHQVDVSNYTQLSLHQIHRSGGSELFWHDMMTSCGVGLFGSDPTTISSAKDYYITTFSILASIVKITSGKVRRLSNSTEFVPRDAASKLLSLELMHHLVHQWGKTAKYLHNKQCKANKDGANIENSPSVTTMAYTIRRLIVTCLLSNTRAGLDDIKVFRRLMRIVSELWCNTLLRRHIKIELGVLIEHFCLKFLRLGPQVLPPKRLSNTTSSTLNDLTVSLLPQQVCIVTEMKTWFQSEPRDILELFMNFDQVDAQSSKKNFSLLPSTHWKITQQLCGALCTLAEQCTDIVSDQIRLTRIDLAEVDVQSVGANTALHHNQGDLREMSLVREGARYLQEKCFETMAQIVRSLMLCAAASSGANYNLLVKLREKQIQQEAEKNAQLAHDKKNGHVGYEDDSSMDSDGNMTVKSVSTLGNIVGGIMNNKKDFSKQTGGVQVPESPRRPRNMPNIPVNGDEGDIVEYWQTSIAAERRKNQLPSPTSGELNSSILRRPPRAGRGANNRSYQPNTPPRGSGATMHARSPRRDDASIISYAEESLRGDPQLSQKFEETLNTAFEIMKAKKSLKKSLEYLIACNILTPSPRDIASFLRLYQARIGSAVVGDFLGEGGKDGDEVEHYNLIRLHYISAISFVGMNVEQGLRHFLTNCGFRLPGEAQKIDRIMTMFSQCYWEDNAGDHGRCPFHDQDTVFLISFAIIMLNTDLHKTSNFAAPPGQSTSKQKQRKKMTKTEFLNNLRGVDNSEDLSRDYLSQIYDSIANNPIAIHSTPESSNFQEGFNGRKTIKFSSGEFGHIIQGNVDLAGMIKLVIKSVKPCQELLRGLSAHEHPYLSIKRSGSSKKKTRKHLVPEELVRCAFSSLWHHFHGTINSALDSAHLDPKGLENCLDVLMYTLCTTICLDQTVERNAFTSQLVRVKFFRENRGLEEDDAQARRPVSRIRDHLDYKNDPWYMRIEKAAESYNENAKIAALDEVDAMFKKLHASLKVDSTLKREMIKVARRIRNGQILLNDPTRYFLKEGELAKRCNRSGRNIKYTFFLFSDVLIYAHKTGNMYKIHGELPLHLMKIMDLNSEKNSKQKKSFHLIHPRKSFVVFASNAGEKTTWLATINAAIGREVKRKARIEGARQKSAAFDR